MGDPGGQAGRGPLTPSDGPTPSASHGGLIGFLRAHPVVCLALLTPGIPEYLSSSSPLLALIDNPAFFLVQLAINVGQYTAGALLVREALLRWRKGWGTVLLLGLAYGLTEEGLGDNTLFNAGHGTDGVLGWYGRFGGVNWVWTTGVLAFHVIYSIGLPILLLGLALPATRGRSLLSRRGLLLALAALVTSTAVETAIVFEVDRFWMGTTLLVGTLAAIALLVGAAYLVPARFGGPRAAAPSARPREYLAIGFAFFPLAFLLEYGFAGSPVPPAPVILTELVVFGILFERVRRSVGRSGNEYLLVDLALGFVAWQSAFGILLNLGLPYTVPLVLLAGGFFVRLRRSYPAPSTAPDPSKPPPGVAAGG